MIQDDEREPKQHTPKWLLKSRQNPYRNAMTQKFDILSQALDILSTLIAFDTTSRHSNLALIEWVEDYLKSHNVPSHRVPNADGNKANLFASIGASDNPSQTKGGVILSGHSDVVPVDGQDWHTNPFALIRGKHNDQDALFARGTCDMKGFIALALAAVPRFKSCAKPVHLAISYDEEVGCQGAPEMIARMAKNIAAPRAAIIGEPSMMKVINGHKGISVYEVEVIGHEAHSSLTHLGISANMVAVELMHDLAELARKLWENADPNSPFVPPHATLTIGEIHGGTAANILARQCRFIFDLRCPPGQNADEILAAFKDKIAILSAQLSAAFDGASITMKRHSNAPALAPSAGVDIENFVRALTGDNGDSGVVSYATEGGQFAAAGFPTVICGPGSIEQAHQPNEYILMSEMEKGAAFMMRLADALG